LGPNRDITAERFEPDLGAIITFTML
jgi:hypothetical protein